MKKESRARCRTVAVRYALICASISLGVLALAWPFVGPADRTGVAVAAGLAWPVQVGSFALLLRTGGAAASEFLKAWIMGFVARLAIVALGAVVAVRYLPEGGSALLLGLAILLFLMLVVESRYFRQAHVPS